MGFAINIDFNRIKKESVAQAAAALEDFADRVVEGVRSRTPEDKGNLVKAINKTEQMYTGTKLLQQVKDTEELEYTAPVEYGVQGKTYNYHKPKGQIFLVGVGAGMFRKTYADLKDKFNK